MSNKTILNNLNNWNATIILTFEQIETIRPVWKKMLAQEPCPVINADIDRYISVLQAWKEKSKPLILLLKQNDQPSALVIGRLEKHTFSLGVGYKTMFRPKLDCLTVEYGGVLGRPNAQLSARLLDALINLLKQREIDVVFFNHLRVDSTFYQQIRKHTPFLCRNHFSAVQHHWRMTIPQNMKEFYAARSKKHRKHLRQYQNKLEREYPEKVTLHTYCGPEEVDRAVKDAAFISKNTYQSTLGVGFEDTPDKRMLLTKAAQKNWLRGHILYIDEEPAAYRFALKYGDTYYGDGIGYHSQWKNFRLGTILFLKVLEILCREQTVSHYDFGLGDAEYKKSYANESWQEASATYIFAPRLRPVLMKILYDLNSGFNLGLTWLLHKTRLFAWIKRIWRKKLQKTKNQNN